MYPNHQSHPLECVDWNETQLDAEIFAVESHFSECVDWNLIRYTGVLLSYRRTLRSAWIETRFRRRCSCRRSVAPMRVRGLKRMGRLASPAGLCRTLRSAWIETNRLPAATWFKSVALFGVCGLKRQPWSIKTLRSWSHSSECADWNVTPEIHAALDSSRTPTGA